MRHYLAPALLLLMVTCKAAPARLVAVTGPRAGSEEVKTLVIDKVVVNRTPRNGPWLICFTASHDDDEVTFNLPNRKFEGSGVEIVLDVEVPGVKRGERIRWGLKLDDDQANVCSVEADDTSGGSFKATARGSKVFSPRSNWSFVIYWHLE